jgi:hypothetical protein
MSRAYQKRGIRTVWPGSEAQRMFRFLNKTFKLYKKILKNLMTLGSCPHYPVGKVALLPIFSSYLSNINAALLSTTKHFKISGTSTVAFNSASLN